MEEKDTNCVNDAVNAECNDADTVDVQKCESKKGKSSKEVKKLEEKLEQLEKELEQTKDAYLRTLAEYDNFKKRETAQREKTASFVKAETMKELLPAVDNINRAIAADETAADYAKGVAMTVKSLTDALKKLGLEEINPINEEFDVNFHQAVMRVEDDSVGNNIVVEVLQSGYKLGDNVLRYAMVKVANCD